MKILVSIILTIFSLNLLSAQERELPDRMDFEEYDPPSSLVVPEHHPTRAKFPFIDIHNHQWNMPTQNLGALLKEMDALNMQVMINLSGRARGGTAYLEGSIENINKTNPKRFIIFTNMDFA